MALKSENSSQEVYDSLCQRRRDSFGNELTVLPTERIAACTLYPIQLRPCICNLSDELTQIFISSEEWLPQIEGGNHLPLLDDIFINI